MLPTGLGREPDFLKLWAGQAISQFGSQISAVGLQLIAVVMLGASPLQMGLLSGVSAASVLLFGLHAGAWVDRLRRRPILIAADVGRMLLLASVPAAALSHRLSMGHLYVVAALGGVLTVLFDVAYQAYLPALVDRANIMEGNSKLALTESIAGVAGPGLAGVLVGWLTAPIAILLDALSFLVSAVSLALIRKPESQPERVAEPRIGREILEGLHACWRDPILRALAARTGTAAFFLGFIGGLYFLFVVRELGVSIAAVGVIIAVGGVTAILGTLLAERVVRRYGYGRTFIGSAVLTGLASLAIPLARGPVTVCCLYLLASQVGDIGWPVYNINETTLRQTIAPAHLLGRVTSAAQLLFRGGVPLGSLAGGALAEWIGVRNTILAGALGYLLSSLWLVFSPVRGLSDLPPAR